MHAMPAPNSEIVALDIGGMSIRSGVVGLDHSVGRIHRTVIDHCGTADELLTSIWASINACRPTRRVAIAIPGPFDHTRGVSSMVHKFAALEGLDLRQELTERAGIPGIEIRFVNDAAAAGAGEVSAAGSPPGHTLALTLGTGLGASMFNGGTLVPTFDGFDISELWSTTTKSGVTADQYFSATGLAATLGVNTSELPTAVKRAEAIETLTAWGHELGTFIESLRPRLDLERVFICGGAAGAFDQFGPAAGASTTIPLSQATLGSSGALLGAALLGFGVS